MNAYQQENERIIVERAHANGGECHLTYGEASAAMRLTERGVGHWEQRHPFIATFVLTKPAPEQASLTTGERRSN